MARSSHEENSPLALPEVLSILNARARLKDDKLTPWREVAEETHHSLTTVYKARKWFLELPWHEVRCLSEEVQQLRPDYLEMKAKELESLRTPPRETRHDEAVRKAASVWIERQRPASDKEIAGLLSGKLNAWGISVEAGPDGQEQALLTISSHPFYDALCMSMVPPIVSEDFWAKVADVQRLGQSLLTDAMDCHRQIEELAWQYTGLRVGGDQWQEGPAMGLTQYYLQTIFETAVAVSTFTNWAYSLWAIAWPYSGGLVITSPQEGLRLLHGRGYDPAIATTYFLTGEPWMLPRSPAERIAYGNTNLVGTCELRFLLCFGGQVISLAYTPDQLELCQAGHQALMQECPSWQRAISFKQTRTHLDSLSNEVSQQLERALYHL